MDVAVALRQSPTRSDTFRTCKLDLSLDSIVQDVVDVLKLHGASISSGAQLGAAHQSFLKLVFSPQFERLLVPAIDDDLGSCFESIRRRGPLPRHIATAGATSNNNNEAMTRLQVDYNERERGSMMLRRFDRLLAPQALARLPRATLQSLYLLMISLVLTTSLMLTTGNSPFPPHVGDPPMTAGDGDGGGGSGDGAGVDERDGMWLAMHQHVSEMTMHYILLLGARIDARIPAHYHKALITQGVRAWTESERRLGVDFILRWPPEMRAAAETPCESIGHESHAGHAHAAPALESAQLSHRPNPSCC